MDTRKTSLIPALLDLEDVRDLGAPSDPLLPTTIAIGEAVQAANPNHTVVVTRSRVGVVRMIISDKDATLHRVVENSPR